MLFLQLGPTVLCTAAVASEQGWQWLVAASFDRNNTYAVDGGEVLRRDVNTAAAASLHRYEPDVAAS